MIFIRITFIGVFSYFIGGYSTSDILRLTKGNAPKQLDEVCRCPTCGYIIPVNNQVPIFSYIRNLGKCRTCNEPIPKISFFLEIIIFCLNILIYAIVKSEVVFFFVGFIVYQIIKVFVILFCGKQEKNFIKRLMLSTITNAVIFASCLALAFMLEFFENLL